MQHDDEIGIVRGCRRARYTKREAKEVGDPRAQKASKVFSIRKNLVTYSAAWLPMSYHYLICSHHLSSWLFTIAKETVRLLASAAASTRCTRCAHSLCRRKEREKRFFLFRWKIARRARKNSTTQNS